MTGIETLYFVMFAALIIAIATRAYKAGRETGAREGYLLGYQDGRRYELKTGKYQWDPNTRPKLHKVQA